jgi:hypothetical protein
VSIVEACSGGKESPDGGTDGSAEASADASGDAPRDTGTPDSGGDGGAPFLTMLSVTAPASGDSSASLTLVPPFSRGIFDYYVRCAKGRNDVTVAMRASRGAESVLIQPTTSPARPSQTLDVSVLENHAIVAAARDDAATTEYWVRCLPHDFPALIWDDHPEAGSRSPGYYLLGTSTPPSTSASYVFVLDGHGVPVWYVQSGAPVAGGGVFDVESVWSGTISFFKIPPASPDPSFEIEHFDPPGTTYASHGHTTDEHELRHLPNGDFLSFSTPLQAVDLTGVVVSLPDGGTQTLNGVQNILGCDIQEFEPDGGLVWTWKATDHFDPRKDTTWARPGYVSAPDGGSLYQVFHCNSIDVDPKNGNLLVSARHMDSVFYVDKPTGTVLWKMGGDPYTKEGAPFIAVASPFFRQHDARLVAGWSETCSGGSGRISVFDDETEKPGPARGVVYDVTVGPADGGAPGCDGGGLDGGTIANATVAWQYEGPGKSRAFGSFRISTDGSRVIGWGAAPHGLAFTETDLAKNDLLDFSLTDDNTSYRATKVPLTAFDLDVLRKTAGVP